VDKNVVDSGDNGVICYADMLVSKCRERCVDVSGLAGHKINQLHFVTAHTLVITHKGVAVATFHQLAVLGKGRGILSCIQMKSHRAPSANMTSTYYVRCLVWHHPARLIALTR
jgi:hypothetical protein